MAGDHPLPTERKRRLARRRTDARPERRIGAEQRQSLGDHMRLPADQEPALPIAHELAYAVHRSGENRQAARRSLQCHQRERLIAGGKYQRVGKLIDELYVARDAEPMHALTHTERTREISVALLIAIAGHHQVPFAHERERVNHCPQPLALPLAPHERGDEALV